MKIVVEKEFFKEKMIKAVDLQIDLYMKEIKRNLNEYIKNKNFWRKLTFRKPLQLIESNKDLTLFVIEYEEFIKIYPFFKQSWKCISSLEQQNSLQTAFYLRQNIIYMLYDEGQYIRFIDAHEYDLIEIDSKEIKNLNIL